VFLPLNLLQRYLTAILQGCNRYGALGATVISVQAVYAIGLILIALVGIRDVGLVLGAILVGNAFALIVALRSLGLPTRIGHFRRQLVRAAANYGIRGHVGNLAPIELLQMDILVVSATLGTYSVGLYVVAASAASLVRFLGFAVGMVTLTQVARGITPNERRRMVASMFRLALTLVLVSSILLELAVGPLIGLIYGSSFVPATPIARVLIIGAASASLRRTLGDGLRGLGHPLMATSSEIVGWCVGGVSLAILIPRMGPLGAAIAVSLSFISALMASVIFAMRSGVSVWSLFRPGLDDLRAALSVGAELGRFIQLDRLFPSKH
jgi:O-antigen/teichoic acid export membrane protein